MTATRRVRYYMECETWCLDGTGTQRRNYRRNFDTLQDAETHYPKLREQMQKDFGARFVELRIVSR